MSKKKASEIFSHSLHFSRVVLTLVVSKTFLSLTLVGNIIILGISYILYLIEKGVNPVFNDYFDAVWWGFATATNVGYGDIVPITTFGRCVGIGLMLLGTALFAMYTALFAQALIEDEFLSLKKKKDHV
ncbi:MAG: hypothetical protein CME62_07140 [Halobacteriovoraceae bacterium]|nr:hypothetical protein [Halobacteriovoraceae bacterium]|tara:strand:+ start:4737 stop:5123 length:387 start_codon:yes stop_codon:yes gene_type:complete